MVIIESLSELIKHGSPDICLSFGNFDGVHVGHKKFLNLMVTRALDQKCKTVLVTFVPHPRKILQANAERFLIGSYSQRRKWLSDLQIDYLVEIPFNRDFNTQSAESFISNHVLTYPGIKLFVLGWDFAFGANKQGDADLLKKLCSARGVSVDVLESFQAGDDKVSSTLVRTALSTGEMPQAKKLLGRNFSIEGVVVRGEGRGRKIGVPTANMHLDSDILVPSRGVYVTETSFKGLNYISVTNIGHNPTFSQDKALTVETHLIDYSGDLYGEILEVQFFQKIRDEKKFQTVNELISQIMKDIKYAKDFKRD